MLERAALSNKDAQQLLARERELIEQLLHGPGSHALFLDMHSGEHHLFAVEGTLLAGRVQDLVLAGESVGEMHGLTRDDGYHGIERLVHEALATRARVIVVSGAAGSELLARAPVAARLRW